MKKKKVFIVIILTIILSIIFMNTSNAALQANNGTKKTYTMAEWLKNIRNMEASGGTFGLNAEIDENTLLDKGSSNGLDVHMEKNTEYGTIAILSASSYGNPENVTGTGATTTGNSTGVVLEYPEFVSAIASDKTYSEKVNNADNRYKNIYLKDSDGKIVFFKGDAMSETKGWQSSEFYDMVACISRGGYIYSYYGYRYYFNNIFSSYSVYAGGSAWGALTEEFPFASRAVVVVGEGL